MDDRAEYDKIKTAALDFLFSGPDPEARETVKTFLRYLETKIGDAAAADRQIDGIVEKLRLAAAENPAVPARAIQDRIGDAMQSPPFYFVFGCLMLVAAFVSTQQGFNSSLTFLIAMLGLAIMLYGTGSQAAGTFGSGSASALLGQTRNGDRESVGNAVDGAVPAEPLQNIAAGPRVSAPMNVAIAGGAAVLSAFFGWSVLTYAPDIRQVFRDDDRYTIVKVQLCDSSISTCRDPAATSSKSREDLGRTSLVPAQAMDQLIKEAYLETSFGHRAYARRDGLNIEFVVFDRDLSDGDSLRIIATTEVDRRTYFVDGSFFDMNTVQSCMVSSPAPAAGGSTQSCGTGVAKADQDTRDPQRVRRLVLRAPVVRAADEFAVQGGSLDDKRPANPISPL